MNIKNKVRDGILGVAIGDMVGVPVEFVEREVLDKNPVTRLLSYASHDQPRGAWSDDTSLTLALADALCKEFSLQTIAHSFLDWWINKKYTSHGYVYDIGRRTFFSVNQLLKIMETEDYEALEFLHYEAKENTNGNGSLMRTLPLYFYLKDKGIEENFQTIWQVSALTHPHIRSALACLMYLIMLDELCKDKAKLKDSYEATKARMRAFFAVNEEARAEETHFERLLDDIATIPRDEIKSSGYVMDTLEASFWCFLTTTSYKKAILKAVNLGYDTDTVGSVTGGLAGIYYGIDTAPKRWLKAIKERDYIESVCENLNAVTCSDVDGLALGGR